MQYPPQFGKIYLQATNNPVYPVVGAPSPPPPQQPYKTQYPGNEPAVNQAWAIVNSSLGKSDPRFTPSYPFLNNNPGLIMQAPVVPGTGAIPFMQVNPTIAANWSGPGS